MPLLPVTPPQTVPIFSGFDYITVDAARRRVYAAHTGSRALAIVDADSGATIGQVRVGPMHGVAVDPGSGLVYTGNGTDRTISEVDPASEKVLRTAPVDGDVDAIALDPSSGRIYADEDDGTRVFVVNAKTMTQIGTVSVPGHKPEYLAVDPETHAVYQNISDRAEVAVIDPASLGVSRTFATPEIAGNHPLQYDPTTHHVLVGGTNGVFAAYDRDGKLAGMAHVQQRIDQCSLDPQSRLIACAGDGTLTILRDEPGSGPTVVTTGVIPKGAHTTAIDPSTGRIFIVWSEPSGDFVRAFTASP